MFDPPMRSSELPIFRPDLPVERYPVHMRTLILVILSVFVLQSLAGCETVSYQSTRDGKTTWRSEQLDLAEDGGILSLSVRERIDEPITVLLLLSNSLIPDEESPREAEPYAAARGVPTNGILRTNFTQLPIASYYVVAFVDRNEDGLLEEGWPPGVVDLDFLEPHSEIQHFHITEGQRVNLSLEIRE